MDSMQKSKSRLPPMKSPKSPMEFHSGSRELDENDNSNSIFAGKGGTGSAHHGRARNRRQHGRDDNRLHHCENDDGGVHEDDVGYDCDFIHSRSRPGVVYSGLHCRTPNVEYFPSRSRSSTAPSASSEPPTLEHSSDRTRFDPEMLHGMSSLSSLDFPQPHLQPQQQQQQFGQHNFERDRQQTSVQEPSAFSRFISPNARATARARAPSCASLASTSMTSVASWTTTPNRSTLMPSSSAAVTVSASSPKISWSSFQEVVGVSEDIVYREQTGNVRDCDWRALTDNRSDVYIDFHGRLYHRPQVRSIMK